MKLSLYHSPWCPFCVRVVSVLKHLDLDIELRDTANKQHFMALREGGGKTQVPCLKIETDKGIKWMYESSDIIHYLKSLS